MWKRLLFAVMILALVQVGLVQAVNVIFVTENIDLDEDGVPDDQSVIDVLRSQTNYTYDVRRDYWMDLEGPDADDYLAQLNAADLIIVSRTITVDLYDNGNEKSLWNSVTTPILCMSAQLCRSFHWDWARDTGHRAVIAPVMVAVDPLHPVFEGVEIDPATGRVDAMDPTVGSGRSTFLLPLYQGPFDVGNGSLIATTLEGYAWIAEWQAGIETYPGSGQIPAGRRMFFCASPQRWGAGTPEGPWNLTPDGQVAFLNAIYYLLQITRPQASAPDPEDGATLEQTWASLSWRPGDFAVSHDMYIGESFDDVNDGAEGTFVGNLDTTTQLVGFQGFPVPEGLQLGTTYYWRIDAVNDANADSPWKGDLWSFWIKPNTAYAPSPANGAINVLQDVTLSWKAGTGAILHQVYFGDDLDTVTNATGGATQTAVTFDPGVIEEGKTYYWRVDEVEAVTHMGDVWSFTTVPVVAVTDPNLAGWWTFDEGIATTAVDWSGQGDHGQLLGDPEWTSGQDGGALYFDGNSSVDCGTNDVLHIGQEITIACWIKPDKLGSQRGLVALDGSYAFKANGDHLRFTTAGIRDHDADTAVITAGTWQHVAVTFQPNQTVAFFINGAQIQSLAASAVSAGAGPFRIGNNQWNERFTGMIDDVRVYNKVLTAEEIAVLGSGIGAE